MKDDDFVGRRVAKVFPGHGTTPFTGRVSSVIKVKNRIFFRVRYEDGDVEDVSRHELLTILAPEGGRAKRRAGSPAVAEPEPRGAKGRRVTRHLELSPPEEEALDRSASPPPSSRNAAGVPGSTEEGEGEEEAGAVVETEGEEEEAAGEEEGGTATPAATAEQPAAGEAESEGGTTPKTKPAAGDAVPDTVAAPSPAAPAAAAPRLRRFSHREPPKGSLRGVPSSEVVAAGGLLFVSDLCRPTRASGEQENITARYRRQGKMVLESLGAALERAGAGPRDLVSLTVRLKDSGIGRDAFGEALRGWLAGAPPPTVTIGESYMGAENTLVGVSAVAVAPAGAGGQAAPRAKPAE